jgi:2-polyprenyl-6-methoxyphenol hydroxylase-like FAD-dependent oxidoreductase
MIAPTVPFDALFDTRWDVVVVGAGPAGALAAYQCARRNLVTLLVDKAEFPRYKVCGSCLNARDRLALRHAGLEAILDREHAVPLHSFHVASKRRIARILLPHGYVSLSRARFDAALVRAAIDAGAHFLPSTKARLGNVAADARTVHLDRLSPSLTGSTVFAKVILAADGLGGSLMRAQDPGAVADHSHIGIGAISGSAPDCYESGVTYMACGTHGYLGLQRLEDGRLDLAAAVNAAWMREQGGPAQAANAILRQTSFPPFPGLDELDWKGTPPLTRTYSATTLPRVLALGDAAGYIEPFTGEGIAWALDAALAVAPIVATAVNHYDHHIEHAWQQGYRSLITRRQWICKAMAAGLRHPRWVQWGVSALSRAPLLARPLIHEINRARRPQHASPC